MLEDKTSPFIRAKKACILKFRHIELAIGGDILPRIIEGCT